MDRSKEDVGGISCFDIKGLSVTMCGNLHVLITF